MRYETEGCSLEVPDVITVRKQLEYASTISWLAGKDRIIKWWEAAKAVITKWECESIPDHSAFDLDASTNPEHARIIGWAATEVWMHMTKLDKIPKN